MKNLIKSSLRNGRLLEISLSAHDFWNDVDDIAKVMTQLQMQWGKERKDQKSKMISVIYDVGGAPNTASQVIKKYAAEIGFSDSVLAVAGTPEKGSIISKQSHLYDMNGDVIPVLDSDRNPIESSEEEFADIMESVLAGIAQYDQVNFRIDIAAHPDLKFLNGAVRTLEAIKKTGGDNLHTSVVMQGRPSDFNLKPLFDERGERLELFWQLNRLADSVVIVDGDIAHRKDNQALVKKGNKFLEASFAHYLNRAVVGWLSQDIVGFELEESSSEKSVNPLRHISLISQGNEQAHSFPIHRFKTNAKHQKGFTLRRLVDEIIVTQGEEEKEQILDKLRSIITEADQNILEEIKDEYPQLANKSVEEVRELFFTGGLDEDVKQEIKVVAKVIYNDVVERVLDTIQDFDKVLSLYDLYILMVDQIPEELREDLLVESSDAQGKGLHSAIYGEEIDDQHSSLYLVNSANMERIDPKGKIIEEFKEKVTELTGINFNSSPSREISPKGHERVSSEQQSFQK